jgi:hypothetical protein
LPVGLLNVHSPSTVVPLISTAARLTEPSIPSSPDKEAIPFSLGTPSTRIFVVPGTRGLSSRVKEKLTYEDDGSSSPSIL